MQPELLTEAKEMTKKLVMKKLETLDATTPTGILGEEIDNFGCNPSC